eukprot:992016-Rhodomonas_salina.2
MGAGCCELVTQPTRSRATRNTSHQHTNTPTHQHTNTPRASPPQIRTLGHTCIIMHPGCKAGHRHTFRLQSTCAATRSAYSWFRSAALVQPVHRTLSQYRTRCSTRTVSTGSSHSTLHRVSLMPSRSTRPRQ